MRSLPTITLSICLVMSAVVLFNSIAYAQWIPDGAAVCTVPGAQQNPVIVSDGAGGAIIAWPDKRSGSSTIYAQRVDRDGVPQWTPDGVAVCTAVVEPSAPTIVGDGAGGAIVAWLDFRNGTDYASIYAQHVLSSGAADPNWPVDGRAICTVAAERYSPAIISDGAGGGIIAWYDSRSGGWPNYDVFTQHVLPTGAVDPAWPPDGRALCTDPLEQESPALVSDGAGGAIVTWYDDRNGTNYPDIYAQHVLATGAVDSAWPIDGCALCTAAGNQVDPTIVSDGAGGAIVTWADARGIEYHPYAQHVLPSGIVDPRWPADGREICTAGNIGNVAVASVSDGSGGAVVSWNDYRTGGPDIYGQHVLPSGAVDPAWPAGGVPLCTAPGDQVFPVAVSDDVGGAIVTWIDNRHGAGQYNYDIYAQRVLATGNADPAWPANGAALCTATDQQLRPMITVDDFGGAIVTWVDQREGTDYDIYAQRVLANGEIPVALPTPVLISLLNAGASPRAVTLRWSIGGRGDAEIYRRTLDTGWCPVASVQSDGAGIVAYQDMAVAPGGRYGYRLRRLMQSGELFSEESWLDVPTASALAIGAMPNPIRGGLRVPIELRNSESARLELLDPQGRCVLEREIASFGPGSHNVAMTQGLSLHPGVYWLRLTQGGETCSAKLCVTQ